MKTDLRRLAVAGLLAAMLAGCGFHLQGNRALPQPLQRVFIDSAQSFSIAEPTVETSLRARLRRRGGTVVGSPATAHSVLRLSDVRERSEVLSIDTSGRAIEFEIIVDVTFSLREGDTTLISPQTLSARRSLSFPSEQILPKEAEEHRLKAFLQDEIAGLIMLQLEARIAQRQRDADATPDVTVTEPVSPALSPVSAQE